MELLNNRYAIIEEIGHGSYGEVFKARDLRTGKTVALKKGANEQEVNMLKSLNHPGIPKFYDSFEVVSDDGWVEDLWIVMELIGGEKLRDYIFKDTQDIARVGDQLCAVLRYLQSRDIAHSDFHDGNIMVTDTQVYVIDYGFARVFRKGHYRFDSERRMVASFLFHKTTNTGIDKWYREVTSDRSPVTLAGMQRRLRKLAATVI